MELTCGLCGTKIVGAYFMSAGIAYHFKNDCQASPEPEPTPPPKTLTEEDVRRIVRDEINNVAIEEEEDSYANRPPRYRK